MKRVFFLILPLLALAIWYHTFAGKMYAIVYVANWTLVVNETYDGYTSLYIEGRVVDAYYVSIRHVYRGVVAAVEPGAATLMIFTSPNCGTPILQYDAIKYVYTIDGVERVEFYDVTNLGFEGNGRVIAVYDGVKWHYDLPFPRGGGLLSFGWGRHGYWRNITAIAALC